MTLAGLTQAYARRVRWEARQQAEAQVVAWAAVLGKGQRAQRRESASEVLGQMGIRMP